MSGIGPRRKLWQQMFNEEKLSLKQVTQIPPHPCLATVRYWIQKGIAVAPALQRGDKEKVKLETIRIGRLVYTTREALERFFQRIQFGTEILDEIDE